MAVFQYGSISQLGGSYLIHNKKLPAGWESLILIWRGGEAGASHCASITQLRNVTCTSMWAHVAHSFPYPVLTLGPRILTERFYQFPLPKVLNGLITEGSVTYQTRTSAQAGPKKEVTNPNNPTTAYAALHSLSKLSSCHCACSLSIQASNLSPSRLGKLHVNRLLLPSPAPPAAFSILLRWKLSTTIWNRQDDRANVVSTAC